MTAIYYKNADGNYIRDEDGKYMRGEPGDCCCDEDPPLLCGLEGEPTTLRLFTASNTCSYVAASTTAGKYGTHADFETDQVEHPDLDIAEICWMWWRDTAGNTNKFMIVYVVHASGNVRVETWSKIGAAAWAQQTSISAGPVTAWDDINGLVTSCGTISFVP